MIMEEEENGAAMIANRPTAAAEAVQTGVPSSPYLPMGYARIKNMAMPTTATNSSPKLRRTGSPEWKMAEQTPHHLLLEVLVISPVEDMVNQWGDGVGERQLNQ